MRCGCVNGLVGWSVGRSVGRLVDVGLRVGRQFWLLMMKFTYAWRDVKTDICSHSGKALRETSLD